jgi:RNA polymerase sigma-70 factor (family 1)
MSPEKKYYDEQVLMESFKNSDLTAFRELYDTFYHPLLNYATRILHDAGDAEDILSESFVILWQKRNDFESFKSVAAFLYTVTRNACFTHLRKLKKKTNAHRELAYLVPDLDTMNSADAIREDLIQFSLIAAQRLPKEMKRVFQLIYMEGFSAAEAAEKLQLSVNTINAQKANAVKRIRSSLIRKGLLNIFF